MDDFPRHGSAQITSPCRGSLTALAGIEETVLSPGTLQRNDASLFEECSTLKEPLIQLEHVLAYGDAIDSDTLCEWDNVHCDVRHICGAAPVDKLHARPPRRQPS
jgi:hypothetical protein